MKKVMAGIILAVLMVAGTAWATSAPVGKWAGVMNQSVVCIQFHQDFSVSSCTGDMDGGNWMEVFSQNLGIITVTDNNGVIYFKAILPAGSDEMTGYVGNMSISLHRVSPIGY